MISSILTSHEEPAAYPMDVRESRNLITTARQHVNYSGKEVVLGRRKHVATLVAKFDHFSWQKFGKAMLPKAGSWKLGPNADDYHDKSNQT
jgi:hypothetical protein